LPEPNIPWTQSEVCPERRPKGSVEKSRKVSVRGDECVDERTMEMRA